MSLSRNLQRRSKKGRQGFSLIELLVVCLLLSFLGTVIYATFYQGINLWKRAQTDRGEYQDVFFAERLNQDLRSAFPLAGQKIRGKPNEFEFYTLLSANDLGLKQVSSELRFPCRVRYYFDSSAHQVLREVQSYSQILTGSQERLKTSVVFQSLKKLEWMFMGRNKMMGILWQKTWEKDYLPNAVKLSVEYESHKQVFIRTLTIPGGGRRIMSPKIV